MATRKSSYDPGSVKSIRHLSGSTFRVESFREDGVFYTVDRKAGTCDCPHFTKRNPEGGCKHTQAVEAFIPTLATEKAKALSTSQLSKHLHRADLAQNVKAAISGVLFQRVQLAVKAAA